MKLKILLIPVTMLLLGAGPIPAFSASSVNVDNLDNDSSQNDQIGAADAQWWDNLHPGTYSLGISTIVYYSAPAALRVDWTKETGHQDYSFQADLTQDPADHTDWESGGQYRVMSFRARATAAGTGLQFQLATDNGAGGDQWSAWSPTYNLADADTWYNYTVDWALYSNSNDFSAIRRLSLIIDPADDDTAGTLYFDNLSILSARPSPTPGLTPIPTVTPPPTPVPTLTPFAWLSNVDNLDNDSSQNDQAGAADAQWWDGAHPGTYSIGISTTYYYSSPAALKVDWTKEAGHPDYSFRADLTQDPADHTDWETGGENKIMTFRARSDTAGAGLQFQISTDDGSGGDQWSAWSPTYTLNSADNWYDYQVDWALYSNNNDFSAVRGISIIIDPAADNTSGTLYLDNLGILSSRPTPTPTPFVMTPTPTPIYHLAAGDYNGDGTSDIAIFRPEVGLWAIRNISLIYFGSTYFAPVPGDYDGDGTTDVAIYRAVDGFWVIRESSEKWAIPKSIRTSRGIDRIFFGTPGDRPVQMDYTGDGHCDIALFRPSSGLWAVRGITRLYFGGAGDLPVPADYDGDGSGDIGIYRSSTGLWAVRTVSRSYFGGGGDIPLPGGLYFGGGSRFTIFRPSSGLWAVRNETRFYLGQDGDIPVPACYTGGGNNHSGIFRSRTGLWAIRNLTRYYYGRAGDIPLAK